MKWFQALLLLLLLSCSLTDIKAQQETEEFWKTWHFQLNMGADLGDTETSPMVGAKAWYFFHSRIGLGPTVQYIDYNLNFEEKIIQVGLESVYRFPLGNRWDALLAMEVGSGHLIVENITEKSGGIYYLPKGGIVFKTKRNIGLSLTAGYLRQPWEIRINDFFVEPTITNVVAKRYRISFGLVF